MKKVTIFLVSMFILGASVFAESEGPKSVEMRDTMKIVDVTEGKEIRGIITSSAAYGNATASYEDGTYELHASFHGLTDPRGDDFYEGWVVQKSPFKFISTGELKLTDGTYTNEFSSTTDYSSYDFYVLTLEPNDGNPAPAAHILEGAVSNQDTMMMSEDTMMKDKEIKSDVIIDLTGKNFAFSQDEIFVKKGDTVTVNFESTGGFHDWGVDEFDAWTDQVNPGIKTSVTFIADTAGTFEYYCSVGSHRAAGMIGKLIVADTTMGDKMMMKREMTPRQKALKSVIESKLATLDIDMGVLLERVMTFRESLDSRNLSASKKAAYIELLDVLIVVLTEKTMMNK